MNRIPCLCRLGSAYAVIRNSIFLQLFFKYSRICFISADRMDFGCPACEIAVLFRRLFSVIFGHCAVSYFCIIKNISAVIFPFNDIFGMECLCYGFQHRFFGGCRTRYRIYAVKKIVISRLALQLTFYPSFCRIQKITVTADIF